MTEILNFIGDNFWASAAIIATMTTGLAGLVNGWLKPNSVWKQVIAWVLSVGLTVGAYFLHIITVSDPVWLSLILTGVVVGLVSNGIYDLPEIKNWVGNWFSTANKE